VIKGQAQISKEKVSFYSLKQIQLFNYDLIEIFQLHIQPLQ